MCSRCCMLAELRPWYTKCARDTRRDRLPSTEHTVTPKLMCMSGIHAERGVRYKIQEAGKTRQEKMQGLCRGQNFSTTLAIVPGTKMGPLQKSRPVSWWLMNKSAPRSWEHFTCMRVTAGDIHTHRGLQTSGTWTISLAQSNYFYLAHVPC